MGTNYYLEPDPAICPTCGHDATMQTHIGKSSLGWVFCWRGYRPGDEEGNPAGLDLVTPTAWFDHLGKTVLAGRGLIRDEYGKRWSLSEFAGLVEGKRQRRPVDFDKAPPRRSIEPEEWTKEGDDMVFGEFS